MKAYIKAGSVFAGDRRFIENYGDRIWIELCEDVGTRPFEIDDLVDRLPILGNFKPSTHKRYIRAVLFNVLAHYEAMNEQPPLKRVGRKIWEWV